ncbi:MAG TPA: hypothetical protein VEY95_16610 [Azospirillaceae bacterium]|nr:hypothetical protein [Azospirillaceae bacterium]
MAFKGPLLAGALMLAPAVAVASSHIGGHPARPVGTTGAASYESPFAAGVPLLDRSAAHPSYGPAPEGVAAEDTDAQAPAADPSSMDHSKMGHGAMNHGAPPQSQPPGKGGAQ